MNELCEEVTEGIFKIALPYGSRLVYGKYIDLKFHQEGLVADEKEFAPIKSYFPDKDGNLKYPIHWILEIPVFYPSHIVRIAEDGTEEIIFSPLVKVSLEKD